MRIYEGSPRQDWEGVLRSIGAYADAKRLKELLFLELEPGFILQGLALPETSTWSESTGQFHKRTVELTEDQVAQMLDERESQRQQAGQDPSVSVGNYYEQALRVLGRYIDQQRARDVFFFEQSGSFVVRLLVANPSEGTTHHLAEFTREEIVAMIEAAPEHRSAAPESDRRWWAAQVASQELAPIDAEPFALERRPEPGAIDRDETAFDA
jgi:hypothetical protein